MKTNYLSFLSKVFNAIYPKPEDKHEKRSMGWNVWRSKANKMNRRNDIIKYNDILDAQMKKQTSKIQKQYKKIQRQHTKLNFKLISNYTSASGTTYKEYESKYKTKNDGKFIEAVNHVFRKIKNNSKDPNKSYKIIINYKNDIGEMKQISTKYSDDDNFLYELGESLKRWAAQYGSSFNCKGFVIIEAVNNKYMGKGSEDQRIENFSDWTILGNKTVTNCLYQAFYISLYGGIPENVVNVSTNLKKKIKVKDKTWSGFEEVQKIANMKKCDIVLHSDDENKSIIEVIKTNIGNKYNTKKKDDIHILFDGKHYLGMFKGDAKIDNEAFKNRETMKMHTEAGKITKKFKENEYKKNFCAWDIEASLDEKKNFKSYAVGFYDGENDYKSWWGLDCLKDFEKYLYDNRGDLNEKVLYAHNSGKFDILLFMSEVLLTSNLFFIDTTSSMGCLELNGRWLNVTLKTSDNCKIHFRDSCALLPGSLDDLSRDFNVKHKKLTETVNHEMITLDNWMTYKELSKYLEYDVFGLYEVVEQFSKDVWEATNFDMNSKEKFVKEVLEELSGRSWEKKRPKWLKNEDKKTLELDCYNEELKMAVEYNGEQHYKPCKWNNFNVASQKKNDDDKIKICKENGVKLLVIPFWMKKEEIVERLQIFLGIDKDLEFDDLGKKITGINVTDCLTGASLSKKFFFSKYYKQDRLPVWTLDDNIDGFIREGYFGGRVEIFRYKKCPGNRFFYYDFTSLFPAMALKLLPYGKPEGVQGKDIDINNFFGFIKCKVTTIRKDIKPLHAKIEDGKLLFKHLKDFEMVLFSEELKQGLKSKQYDYEFIEGVKFNSGYVMRDMSNDVFQLKAKAKDEGKDALSLVWKIILNSSYGFWGLRTHERDAVKVYPVGKAPVCAYLNDGKLKDESDIGNYTLLRVLNDLEVTDFNVGIASAITSYARCELWNLINDIESKGHNVFMCDTDSVVCDLDLNDYPDIKKRYQWDGCGDELGCVKNELNDAVLKKMKKELNEEEKNRIKKEVNLYFDEAIFNGAKYYGLRSKDWKIEIAKCKGFKKIKDKKLKFDELEKPLEQTTKQFVCGLQGYMNPEDAFKINVREIKKTIKPQYNKAIVNVDGSIRPYEADEKIPKAKKK